jgi:hypothetical protein
MASTWQNWAWKPTPSSPAANQTGYSLQGVRALDTSPGRKRPGIFLRNLKWGAKKGRANFSTRPSYRSHLIKVRPFLERERNLQTKRHRVIVFERTRRTTCIA